MADRKTIQTLLLAFVVLPFFLIESRAASIIVNGSFEDASVDPGTGFLDLLVGDTSITGWTVLIADIHYIGTAWEASDGTKSLDLDGLTGSAGAIAQTFSTTPGEMYEVAFDMAGNYGAAPTIKQMRVSADGQSADFDFDITGRTATDMGWTTHSWSFLADDTSATLQFASLTNLSGSVSGWGPALDNVSVTLVPIPAAGLLFGSALAVLGWIRRRSLH